MKGFMKCFLAYLLALMMMTWIFPPSLLAQDSTSAKQKAYLAMKYVREDGEGKVYFRVFTREGENKIPVQYTIVNLFINKIKKSGPTGGMMGNITTDKNGEGAVPVGKNFDLLRDSLEFHFIGSLKHDPRLQDIEKVLNVKAATLELSLFQKDSIRYARATLKEKDTSGAWVPVPNTGVVFYVKKYFCLLPTVYTDENGEALLEIPDGLIGDSEDNLKVVAKIDANDEYGTLIATAEKKWGAKIKQDNWEDRPLHDTIIIGLWTVILYFLM